MVDFKYGLYLIILLVASINGQTNEGDSCYESHTRSYGTCKRTNECATSYSAYVNNNIRYDICGYYFDLTIICCVDNPKPLNNRWPNRQPPNNRPTPPPTTSTTTTTSRPIWSQPSSPSQTRPSPVRPSPSRPSSSRPSGSRRIAEQKCEQYSEPVTETFGAIALLTDPEVTKFHQPKCDYISNPLVVGGNETEVGEFPHMAAIGWKLIDDPGYAWLCGGSLISERYILTAGHCTFQSRNTNAESGKPSVARLGDHDLRDDIEDFADPITIEIVEVIKNPGYKSPSKYHDIALFKLAQDVEFNSYVRPACLYTKFNMVEKTVIATGWGTTSFKASITSNVLRKVALKVFSNEECQPNFTPNRNWRTGFSDDQMCAGDDLGGKDTCQGDSGGPLQVESSTNPCVFYIVGVTGFGGECGNAKGSGVYAIVSHYLDWIESVVWSNN